MKYRWSIEPPQPLLSGHLARALNLSPLLAQCLINRGFSDPDRIACFLDPKLKQLADPFLLPNMTAAIERLFRARQTGEPLVVFGDYDVDGVTSTALLLQVLTQLGWTVQWYLPHRMDDGYGLSRDGLENCLHKSPATLLLAVDCGSTAAETVAWLKTRRVDVLVLDHHQVSQPAPDAAALVNPLCAAAAGRPPPFAELCSAGLAFKLAHAIVKHGRATGLPGAADFDLRPLLDLVALGTIADIVPLTGENRILVSAGLRCLNDTRRPGLVALKEVAGCSAELGTHEVAFQLAPRLNAAGRLETAEHALNLLLARDLAEALPVARMLDACNRERQQIEKNIADQVIHTVRSRFNPEKDFVIVEGQSLWHVGVIGIVASRVLREFYRPTVIIGGDSTEWRGSGRSIAGFDLAAALRQCSDLLLRHGGHALAAGLSLPADNLDKFRDRLNQLARQSLQPADLQPPLRLDAEVGLEEMSLAELRQLHRLRPVGQGNPAVHFFTRNLCHQRPLQRVGSQKQHVKMWVTDGAGTHEAVWWGAGEASLPAGRFDLAFAPQINAYNHHTSVQLKVLDWKPAG